MPDLTIVLVSAAVGFALGYGVREFISYRRHQAVREKRRFFSD
jgi:uncharacterized membrane protein SpoIIM required for sporulation